jgi:hypothetical protein
MMTEQQPGAAMARGGLGQRRQPRHSGAFLHPGAAGQAKPQARRCDTSARQQAHDMISLGPAFRPQPMIRYQSHHPPAPRCRPVPRQQGNREAMRPA